MVDRIVRDLASITGETQSVPDLEPAGRNGSYRIGDTELQLQPSCWDPASFAPLVAAWAPHGSPDPSPRSDLLTRLQNPSVAELQAANEKVSAELERNPLDASAHDRAALVLGALGLREDAGDFSDLRPLLCRTVAHLTMARQLRGDREPNAEGRVAAAIFETLAGRPRQALDHLDKLPEQAATSPWKRALRIEITGDWRLLPEPEDATVLEKIILVRAIGIHRGSDALLELVGRHEDMQRIAAWSRSLAAGPISVDQGHLLQSASIALELQEINERFLLGESLEIERLEQIFGAPATARLIDEEGRVAVVSEGDWADYFRRHFFHAASAVQKFIIQKWTAPEAAEDWEAGLLPVCRAMGRSELVAPLLATSEASFLASGGEAGELIRQHPELVPMALWFNYRFPILDGCSTPTLPSQTEWSTHVSPPGTAYLPRYRTRHEGILNRWSETMKQLHAIDPWDPTLCREVAEIAGNRPEDIASAWGNLQHYSIRPHRQALNSPHLDLEESVEVLQHLSELDLDHAVDLGRTLVVLGRPEEAIEAFERAFEEAPDRVKVANLSQWMIHHYLATGDAGKAREVADHNAKVFSDSGLESAISLAVVEDRLDDAMGLAVAMRDRYGRDDHVHTVEALRDPESAGARKIFPDGKQKVRLADFDKEQRHQGLQLQQVQPWLKPSGLRSRDLVLAFDGCRVTTVSQLNHLQITKLEPHVPVIVRRGRNLLELNLVLPERRFQTFLEPATR